MYIAYQCPEVISCEHSSFENRHTHKMLPSNLVSFSTGRGHITAILGDISLDYSYLSNWCMYQEDKSPSLLPLGLWPEEFYFLASNGPFPTTWKSFSSILHIQSSILLTKNNISGFSKTDVKSNCHTVMEDGNEDR